MKITNVDIVPVKVPAKAGSIHSDSLNDPLHMDPVAGQSGWTVQFDKLTKCIYLVHTDAGITGLGGKLSSRGPRHD